MAFQTHEGVFAWSRLTMGCRLASQIQQTAYYNAMDKFMPAQYRHCIAMFVDDMAAGADSLEELFEIYKALVTALDKAGIQVKASKVEFGVEEITFHNYRIVRFDTARSLSPSLNSKHFGGPPNKWLTMCPITR